METTAHSLTGANINQNEKVGDAPSQQQQSTNVGAQDIYSEFIGAIKIRDGLFIGDQLAAQDYEFVITNKVTHIINTAGLHIRNYWESIGVKYLTFDWVDQDCQVILDSNNNNANKIFYFIEEAYEQGESCLVHSVRGQSRASTVLAAYFMKKYKWSLYKTIEFLNNRRPDLEIRASFIRQLSYYEKRLLQETGVQSDAWTELASKPHLENDELILTHTFLNAQMGPFADFSKSESFASLKEASKLKWIDERQSQKQLLITNNSKDDLIHKSSIQKVTSHHKGKTGKSIIKVPYDQFYLDNQCDTEEGDTIEQKQLMTMDTKSDHENFIPIESETTKNKHSKSAEETCELTAKAQKANKSISSEPAKAFDYSSKQTKAAAKEEAKHSPSADEKPKHKASNSVDKTKIKDEIKSLNFKAKKLSDNSAKNGGAAPSFSNQAKDVGLKFKQSIKKDSIKLKNEKAKRTNSAKRPKSKDTKCKRRPRSNDDRK